MGDDIKLHLSHLCHDTLSPIWANHRWIHYIRRLSKECRLRHHPIIDEVVNHWSLIRLKIWSSVITRCLSSRVHIVAANYSIPKTLSCMKVNEEYDTIKEEVELHQKLRNHVLKHAKDSSSIICNGCSKLLVGMAVWDVPPRHVEWRSVSTTVLVIDAAVAPHLSRPSWFGKPV